jgi:hypothetical protein
LDSSLFYSGIKEIFYQDEKKSMSKVYQELNKLNNGKNFFITTNIDKGFEKYLGLRADQPSIFPSFRNKQIPLLTYLHGRIDKVDSWIFTRDQAQKIIDANKVIINEFYKHWIFRLNRPLVPEHFGHRFQSKSAT